MGSSKQKESLRFEMNSRDDAFFKNYDAVRLRKVCDSMKRHEHRGPIGLRLQGRFVI
jgi:hypothetical protein